MYHYLFEEVRQNTSAYVSIRQHMHKASAYIRVLSDSLRPPLPLRRGTSAYISIRQLTHTASAYVRVLSDSLRPPLPLRRGASEYVSIRQHTSAYAYVSICIRPLPIYASCLTLCGLHYLFEEVRQNTSAYVSIR
jgi:hypothetical protein